MFTLLGGIWGKIATALVGLAGIFAALFGWSLNIKKSTRLKIQAEQQQKTLERLKIKDEIERNIDNAPGDVKQRLRDKGYIRD